MRRPLISVFLFLMIYNIIILSIIHFTHIQPENYSIQSLQIVNNWHTEKLKQHHFIPKINSTKSYYLSHPPFAYYFLYGFQRLTGTQSYFVLNSFLVSISALFIYLTIALLALKKAKTETSLYSWIGMVLYLSSYPVLKFQYFNFHPDIFVITPLIAAQYVFLKLLMKERYRSVKYIIIISLLLIIVNYSSWFGVIFSFIISLIALFNLRKGYKLFPYIFLALFIAAFSTILTYSQYAIFGGWKNVIYYFKDTYLRESPLFGHLRHTFIQIILNSIKSIGFLLLILISLVTYSIMSRRRKFLFTKNGYRYLILSLFPTFFYSVLLIQYFQNEFVSLYFIAPLIVSICIWMEKLFRNQTSISQLSKLVLLIIISNLLFSLLLTKLLSARSRKV
jgi:hypothetical protein